MSFPLAQDIGYDPSIYTSLIDGKYALVRDVVAEGQTTVRAGLLQPVSFRIMPESAVRVKYRIEMSGKTTPGELVVSTPSGIKYSASLPTENGDHSIDVRGSLLRIPPSGEDVELIVIEADTAHPIPGSHNRLIVESMSIEAKVPASVSVMLPHLVRSAAHGAQVANALVRVSDPKLSIQLGPDSAHSEITLYDGSDHNVKTEPIGAAPISLGPSPSPGLWRAHITSSGAQSDFRFLVLGKVPPHPRLLLTPERLEELRSHIPSDALRNLIREQAAYYAAQISYNPKAGDAIRLLSPDSVFPGLADYSHLLDQYGNAIVLNALDYRLRDSKASLDTARRALLAVSQWPTWTPTWFKAHGLHTYYQTGIFSQRTAFGYDLIADELQPDEKAQIADAFYRNAIAPAVEEYFLNNRMPLAASNHMAHAIGGAIADCIAVYGDVPDWDARFAPALAELIVSHEDLLRGLFPGDGSEAEPIGYEDFALEGMSVGAAALQRIGVRPNGTQRMIQSFWWPYYVQYKPGCMLDTGDFIGALSSLTGYAWAAENGDDPTLRAFYNSAVSHNVESVFKPGGEAQKYAPDMLDLVCCTKPAGAAPPSPSSRLFPLRGSAALRSGWGSDATVVSLRVGPWFNHEHHDEGSFQVASHGEVLIGEAGYTEYYSDPRYQNYFTQVPGHNTAMLDDDAFSQNSYQGRYWKGYEHYPSITRHILGDGIDYLSADLAPAYGGALTGYTREFLYLKPGLLLVHDRISGTSPHRYSFLLHVPPGAVPSSDGTRVSIRGKAASSFIVAAGTAAHWQLDAAPVPVIAYGNFDKVPVEERNTFRLVSAASRSADFTVGMQFLPSIDVSTLKAFSKENADGFSSETGNVVALFRKETGEDISEGDISTDGDALARVVDNGKQRLFAAQSRTLRKGGHTLLSFDSPVDAEITENAKGDTVQTFSARPTQMYVGVTGAVRIALVDGKTVEFSQNNNLIQIKLTTGEHRVQIEY